MTSPVDTSVKYFHSAMPDAPVLNGTPGSVIAILDASLINGFGLKTVDSLVVAGNVATACISTGHSAEIGSVVLVAGATPAELNGEQRVTATTANTVSFATTGITDQTATGTITLKLAPAGWAKPYSGTNLAVYQPTDVTATGCLLRVDDTVGKTARVVGYETMSDVSTGTGLFPNATQRSGGCWWSKSNTADSAARDWLVAVDKKTLYFVRTRYGSSATLNEASGFGDILPVSTADTSTCFLSGTPSDVSGGSSVADADTLFVAASTSAGEVYLPRGYAGVGSPAKMRKTAPAFCASSGGSWTSGKVSSGVPYPNPTDGGLYLSHVSLTEDASLALRGNLPGLYLCPQAVPTGQFSTRDGVAGVTGLPGRILKASTCDGSAPYGVAFFDITGPWR